MGDKLPEALMKHLRFGPERKVRKPPQSHWEIHWDDGQVHTVRRHGREWAWWCRGEQSCQAYSSHLDGIRDHLDYNRKHGLVSGELVRVHHHEDKP